MVFYTFQHKNREIDVLYTNSLNEAEEFLHDNLDILEENEMRNVYIGFDIEWRPTIRPGQYNKTAVLQLSVSLDKVLILQLQSNRKKIQNVQLTHSKLINKILTDPRYLKCGVGVRDDCKKLKKDLDNLYICSFLCLDDLAKDIYEYNFNTRFGNELNILLKENYNYLKTISEINFIDDLESNEFVNNIVLLKEYIEQIVIDPSEMKKQIVTLPYPTLPKSSLKYLSNYFLNIKLEKTKRIIMSNWETYPLSERQIQYAALDSMIGLELTMKLIEEMKSNGINETRIKDYIIR